MIATWEIKTLGELCDIYNGGTPSTAVPEYWDGGIEWITPKDMGNNKSMFFSKCERTISKAGVEHSSTRVLPERSVILSSRAPIGYVTINEVPMATNQGCKGFAIKSSIIPEYLYFFLLSSTKLLNDLGAGATFKEVSGKKLSSVEIPLPPISEQRRIVDVLIKEFERIDSLKALAERSLQNSRELYQSALSREFEPKNGWKTKKLGDVCDVQCGSTPLRSEPAYWENGTYPWFTVDDIREQGRIIDHTKQKITKLAWDKLRVFPANTVLLCCTASVGEYAMTTIPLTSNQQFNGLSLKEGCGISSKYLFYFAATLKNKLMSLSGKATIDFVSGTKVKNIPISFPLIEEQNRIVRVLESLDAKCQTLQDNYNKTIVLCDDLKHSLFRKAFNGEL